LNPTTCRQIAGSLPEMARTGQKALALSLVDEVQKLLKQAGETELLNEFCGKNGDFEVSAGKKTEMKVFVQGVG
jgi:hypothetical protein